MEQIKEGGKKIHEIHKINQDLESDKLYLEGSLEDTEKNLIQKENQLKSIFSEVNKIKDENEYTEDVVDEETVVGLVSWGLKCADATFPGVLEQIYG